MSSFLVKKSSLRGKITAPSSKSHSMRAILFAALGYGKSKIHHFLPSTDTQAMIDACRLFGASIKIEKTKMEIQGISGKFDPFDDVCYAGNSGIVLRFCSAIGALFPHPFLITGDASIRHQRPMKALLDALSHLGVSTTSLRGDGFAPLILKGPIKPGKTSIQGEDSQPVSALLIASSFVDGPVEIYVQNPGEKPWLSLTLDWFKRLGISYENRNFDYFRLLGPCRYEGFEYFTPGDWSSAAFPIAAALVTNSELLIQNIDIRDSQGDKEIVSILQKMGAHIEIDEKKKTLLVKKSSPLRGISIDINPCIDAIVILAVVACFAEGKTLIYNGAIAKQKESNRIHAISVELQKMGATIEETEDGLWIRKSNLKGCALNSHFDHRVAMSLAIAALGASGESLISPVECIGKTFSTFARDFHTLGANIETIP